MTTKAKSKEEECSLHRPRVPAGGHRDHSLTADKWARKVTFELCLILEEAEFDPVSNRKGTKIFFFYLKALFTLDFI